MRVSVPDATFAPAQQRGYQLATAAKLRDVRRGWIWIPLERCHVLTDSFERWTRYPAKHCRYNEILVCGSISML